MEKKLQFDSQRQVGEQVTTLARKIVSPMSPRQCEIAVESYTACLMAQCGYDVLVQYGANQPHYDLVAVKDKRFLPISVKGSQDGGWMLAVRFVKPGVNYHAAINQWLSIEREDVIYLFVQFFNVPLGQAPAFMLPAHQRSLLT